MQSPTSPRHTPGPGRLAQALLPVLYQHRLVTTGQLQQMFTPGAASADYVRRNLHQLRDRQLAAATLRHRGGRGELAWYCTSLGAEVVETAGEVTRRAYRMSEQAAAGQLQEHTFAVTDSGLAFMRAARLAEDECGPLDWDPELAHRLRDGDSRIGDEAVLVPDAVLSYVRHDQNNRRMLLTFFLELDRATMGPARLADKIRAYARYQTYTPTPAVGRGRNGHASPPGEEAWRGRYPVYPRLLIILTGAPERALARRTADVRALAAADTRLRRAPGRLAAGITTLHRLQTDGPWAPIVTPVFGDPTLTDVLMNSSARVA